MKNSNVYVKSGVLALAVAAVCAGAASFALATDLKINVAYSVEADSAQSVSEFNGENTGMTRDFFALPDSLKLVPESEASLLNSIELAHGKHARYLYPNCPRCRAVTTTSGHCKAGGRLYTCAIR